jgi:hypothetical protein
LPVLPAGEVLITSFSSDADEAAAAPTEQSKAPNDLVYNAAPYSPTVRIDYVPTLAKQRELYAMPRDMTRFKRYLWELTQGSEELVLPLVDFNPMGREHVAQALDRLIALDADAAVRQALDAAASELPGDREFRATLVLSDDIGGMWTHRRTTDLKRRWNEATTDEGSWLVPLASHGPAMNPPRPH